MMFRSVHRLSYCVPCIEAVQDMAFSAEALSPYSPPMLASRTDLRIIYKLVLQIIRIFTMIDRETNS